MNRGEIVEHGTPEELLEMDGLYRQLHDVQAGRVKRRRLSTIGVVQGGGGQT
jgi:hypothetical protein